MISIKMETGISWDSVITKELCGYLESTIAKHHKLYLELSGRELLPKLHYQFHYPCILMQNRPALPISTIRMKGKHKNLNNSSPRITGRLNAPVTLAMKYSLKQCFTLIIAKEYPE